MAFLIIIIGLTLLIALTRVTTVVIHELGHAITGLLLFKGEVSIYIGSYGDPKKGIHFNIGRLQVHFKYNPFMWNHGLCTSADIQRSFLRVYLFTLSGPIATLILSMLCLYLLIAPEIHGALKLISLSLFFSSFYDFVQNIRPVEYPIILHNGTLTYNDGQTLKLLKEYRNVYSEVTLLSQYYLNNEIDNGIEFFKEIYSTKPDSNVLRMGIALYIKGGYYKNALTLFNKFNCLEDLNSDDHCYYGLIHSFSGNHLDALKAYNKALELNSSSFFALNNRGYTLNKLGRYKNALLDFNRAIDMNGRFAYSYSNRGLSKIKLDEISEGLSDIEKAIEIDPKDSYAYKNLGIFHKENGQLNQALNLFLKAKKHEPKTEGLVDLISETQIEIQTRTES
ncbi:MAG: tetratricopeptide repeat protein [Cyclobacteriaceae bacterium]